MIGVIIQARLGSKRLPKKIFELIGQKNFLEHIIFNVKNKLKYKVVIATSKNKLDDELVLWCKKNNLAYFRGPEQNVLKRFYMCAKKFRFTHVVRITADNPFTDIDQLKKMIKIYLNYKLDYISNINSLPKGLGSEILSFNTIKISLKNSSKSRHFEHVNEYVLENLNLFKSRDIKYKHLKVYKLLKVLKLNFSIDTKIDLKFVRKIYKKYNGEINFKKIKNDSF
jgi:spore coat polysaccharide biosynthesis protein SpsF